MWNFLKSGIFLMFVASLMSCGNVALSDRDKAGGDANGKLLPLPDVPESFVSTEARAGYMLRHFWDGLDFGRDTLLCRDREFMEQNFVNYVSIFNLSDNITVLGTVKRLLYEAHKDSLSYVLLVDIAEKYLYDPESPMLDENAYETFLNAEREESGVYNTPERKSKIDYQLSSILKNRMGSEASDFNYSDADGRVTSLDETLTPGYMLLVFFDPACSDCRKCVDLLENDVTVNNLLERHRMTVLAVDVNRNRDEWKRVISEYPDDWLLGYDVSDLRDKEIYSMRNMPSMYLLDNKKVVVLKDVSVENLFSFLCDEVAKPKEPSEAGFARL